MKFQTITKESVKTFFQRPLAQIFALAALLHLVVDCFARESLLQPFLAMASHPLIFLYSVLLIAITLTPALFFARRFFFYALISVLWIGIGVTDFVLLQFRTTPFTFVDITMIQSAIAIWDHYLTIPQLILIAVLIILVMIGGFFLFRKCIRLLRLPLLKVFATLILMIASAIVATNAGIRFGLLSENFGNLADAYHQYGLPYCFISSIINTGISKPKNYSDEYVQQLIEAVENGTLVNSSDLIGNPPTSTNPPAAAPSPTPTPEPTPTLSPSIEPEPEAAHSDSPNIIFLQLESFFDPTAILGSTFTKDPIPNYHRLMKEFTSGYVIVPSVGAGTANTEFEMITGMNLDFFGPGEYPYKTILKETTCESISYVLKTLGYRTHAIHNNDGTFYSRNVVYSQLGFDTFTSIEYMYPVERTPLNWAKDSVLTGEIKKILASTEESDFIYAVSVQGHGAYPAEPLLTDPVIDLTLPDKYSEETYYQLLYYTNQIYEMDAFVGELTAYLESCDEDTVLVMFGDHLPGLKFNDEDLSNGSIFETPYILWSNFELEAEHPDLEAYQLYSYVLERLGIHDGIINKFHQTQKESDIYLEDLEILEYDMLYGDQSAYHGENPYKPTELQMGITPITISGIRAFPDNVPYAPEEDATESTPIPSDKNTEYTIFLSGTGFTPYSVIQVDGKEIATMFVSDTILSMRMHIPPAGSEIRIAQQGTDEFILSTSEPFELTEEILAGIFPGGNPVLPEEE